MQKRHTVPILFALLLGVFISDANSTTLAFTDKAVWLSNLTGAVDFSLDAPNVALAKELVE